MTIILDIDHEAGNLSEWTNVSDTGGDLSASNLAGLAGTSYGLACRINDTQSFYAFSQVTDNTSGVVRIRFYFDPNSITMADDTNHFIGVLRSNTNIANIKLKWTTADGYGIQAQLVGDSATLSTAYYPITDAEHYIEIQLTRSTNSTSNDGTLDLWIDGVHKEQLVADNFDMFPYFRLVRLGATSGVDGTTSGTYYFDEIIVNDDGSEIGAVGGGGTLYTQSVSGGITPAGVVAKQGNKALTGAISSIAGTLIKIGDKLFSGSTTPTGTIIKQTNKSVSGSISTIQGVLEIVRLFAISLSGSITPDGDITKQISRALLGGSTPSGDVNKQANKSFSGSNTPSGNISKLANKQVSGDVTITGLVVKTTNKILSGMISTIGGTLNTLRLLAISLSGSIDSVGSIIKQANKILSGTISESGNLSRQANKQVAGSQSTSSDISKVVSKSFFGDLMPSSDLSVIKLLSIVLSGQMTLSGALSKLINKDLSGNVSSSGNESNSSSRNISGNIFPVGSVIKLISRFFTGIVSSSGILTTVTGVVTAIISKVLLLGSIALKASLSGSLKAKETLIGSIKVKEAFRGVYKRIISLLGNIEND